MSTNPTPKGRLPRSVYVKRRLWVFGGLIAVIVIIVLLIWRPGASADDASATKTPSSSSASTEAADATGETAAPADTEAADDGAVAECTADTVEVTAITDKDTYASGEYPKLSLSVKNVSDAPCTIDVGTSQQVFTISSGSDTYWRSTDCQSEPTNAVTELAAGQELTTETPIEWDRTRSSTDTCDSDSREAAPGNGASYHLETSVAGIEAADSKQFILY